MVNLHYPENNSSFRAVDQKDARKMKFLRGYRPVTTERKPRVAGRSGKYFKKPF